MQLMYFTSVILGSDIVFITCFVFLKCITHEVIGEFMKFGELVVYGPEELMKWLRLVVTTLCWRHAL